MSAHAVMNIKSLHQSLDALGSTCDLTITSSLKNTHELEEIARHVWLEVAKFERLFSRFIPGSELSHINARAGISTPVSRQCYDLLRSAKLAAGRTDDAFNPFVLPGVQRAGYLKSRLTGREEDETINYTYRAIVPSSRMRLQSGQITIPYNTAIDFGGCGKGYLAEKIADYLESEKLDGFWISIGGDAVGSGSNEHGSPWQVGIALEPNGPEAYIVMPEEKRFGVATSGTTVHKSHIVDGKTGKIAQTKYMVATVLHDSAFWADILASIVLTTEPSKMSELITKHNIKKVITFDQNQRKKVYERKTQGGIA